MARGTSVVLTVLLALCAATASAQASKSCEVCMSVLDRVAESLAPKATPADIEDAIKALCATAEDRDERFCYYVGGTPDAATYILREISMPMSSKVPSKVICDRLKKLDAQICELTYPAKIDLDTVDLKTLRVKQLRKIVTDLKGSCTGCTEKSDFIREIERIRGTAKTEL